MARLEDEDEDVDRLGGGDEGLCAADEGRGARREGALPLAESPHNASTGVCGRNAVTP